MSANPALPGIPNHGLTLLVVNDDGTITYDGTGDVLTGTFAAGLCDPTPHGWLTSEVQQESRLPGATLGSLGCGYRQLGVSRGLRSCRDDGCGGWTVSGSVVRAAAGGDADVLRRLAIDNGLFEPDDMDDFDEMLGGYLDGTPEHHSWIVLDDADLGVLGAAYYAPEPFGDRVWNLYFIAVAAGQQRAGAGSVLIGHVEADLRGRGEGLARVLIVETSSLDGYEQARRF